MATGGETLVLDNFQSDGVSSIGTRWEGFSDRVMGGVSTMRAGYDFDEGQRVLRMVGQVSLENNGGFIQVRLPVGNRVLDASEYTGIAVETKGVPGSYYIHVRTRNSRLPWQYYDAAIPVSGEWGRVEIPFSAFQAQSLRGRLDGSNLVSVAVVGGKAEFDADVSVRLVELYK